MSVEIKIRVTEDAVIGYDSDVDGAVDVGASLDKYTELLEKAIRGQYPGAEIEISIDPTTDKITVYAGDIQEEKTIQEDIQEIQGKVYSNMEWVVEI